MTARADQASGRIMLFGIALIWMIAQISLAVAHESWINHGGYGNPAGKWCCGDNDCESPAQIAVTGKGWVVRAPNSFRSKGDAEPGRKDKDMDLPKARSLAPLRVRSAARFLMPDEAMTLRTSTR
jgi:hypothetical protein